jgi:hypothetical protein
MARSKRLRSGHGDNAAALGGIALICLALAAFGGLAYFYFSRPQKPQLDRVSLCPVTGPHGIVVMLVDTTDDLDKTTKQDAIRILDDEINGLPPYFKLDVRVLDTVGARSQSLFAKCNPGDGAGLSEWTDNPTIARRRWLENFQKPAADALKHSLVSAKAANSPIMAAIQDIAIDQFSSAAVRDVPKSLIVISDMLEFTPLYSQYPRAGDLTFARYKRSAAYLKYRTDLHGARVKIKYVRRPSLNIPTVQHMEFWVQWVADSQGIFKAKDLQGAN